MTYQYRMYWRWWCYF